MTRHEQDRVASLDRQWDRYLSGVHNVAGNEDELKPVARLHALDDTPAAPDDFREGLHDELQRMFAEQAPGQNAADSSTQPIGDDTLALHPASGRRGPISVPDTGRFRRWGELAAMLLVLIVAIAATALYGDDAHDFAQRQIATDPDDTAIFDEREALEEEGYVDGLNFEQAQALTPFEMAEPIGMSVEQYAVEMYRINDRGRRSWTRWQASAELVFENGDQTGAVRQQPARETLAVPMPRVDDDAGPSGQLDTIEIAGQGTVRVLDETEEGEQTTHYLWEQGGVDIWLEIPFDDRASDASVNEVDLLIASIAEQGPLDDGVAQIGHRGMTLEQFRETFPTAPVADPTPEHLELSQADNWIYGPQIRYQHLESEEVGDIRVRAIGAALGQFDQERREDAGTETFHVGDVPVSRIILMDPFQPETAEFIERLRIFPDLLLPWISNASETALAVYMWDVAGMSYLMEIELPRDQIDTEASDSPVIATDVPESSWLEIIASQEAFAAEFLDPEDIFPVLAREPVETDEPPEDLIPGGDAHADWRLLRETEDGRFYLTIDSRRNSFMLFQIIDVDGEDEPRSSGGAKPIFYAAEVGIGIGMGGGGAGFHVAYALPQGYVEVVDENGDLVAEVEDQLFAISFESGEERPQEMIARGPAGELNLEIGTREYPPRDAPGLP